MKKIHDPIAQDGKTLIRCDTSATIFAVVVPDEVKKIAEGLLAALARNDTNDSALIVLSDWVEENTNRDLASELKMLYVLTKAIDDRNPRGAFVLGTRRSIEILHAIAGRHFSPYARDGNDEEDRVLRERWKRIILNVRDE